MLGCGVPKAHPCRTCWSLSWMSAAGYRTEDRPLVLCGRPLRLGRAGTLPLRNHRLPPALAQRRGRCLAAPWRWRFPPPRRRKAATCTAWSEVSWRLATWTRSGPAGARSVGPLRGAGFAAVAGVRPRHRRRVGTTRRRGAWRAPAIRSIRKSGRGGPISWTSSVTTRNRSS